MSQLTIFADNDAASVVFQSQDSQTIAAKLAEVGILFERWQTLDNVTADSEAILQAYQTDIERIKQTGGYTTVDVIALAKGTPNTAPMRQKFLSEHTHSEDEVRFFVQGQGLFCLHINNQVLQVLCCKNDLISVPANTPHWFDMGSDPEFTAIRFFSNEQGWVAQMTGSDIAGQFPLLD